MENVLNNPTLSYRRQVWRRTAALAAIFGLTLLVGIYAVTQGAYNLSPMQAIRALIGNAGEGADVVVWNIRLPRIIASLVVGWGLALSGLGIQSLLRNPLGSPSTLGISQGAAFGVAAAIVFLHAGIVSVTIFAFMGAMGATMIILILARLKRLSPEAIILSGVALSALFGSATILIQYLATDIQLAAVVFWTFGDVARSGWREIGLLTLVVSLVSVFFVIQRWDLNALDSGEEAARGLGVNVERLRLQGMVAAALIAALATAFHGVIAFVGLIAPHMARRLVGTDHCLLIPFSAVLGALLLLSADTLSVNPDVIFIDAGGLTLVSEDYRKKPEFYNALKAFQTRRVVILHPFNFYTTNIDTALTDAWVVGKILYPDRFKDIDLEKKANEIYTFFVGRPVYEQMKQAFGAIGQTAPFITAKAGS